MSLLATINRVLFKRTSTFAVTIVAGAFFFERTFDMAAEKIFESINKGKLWKDIEDNYKE